MIERDLGTLNNFGTNISTSSVKQTQVYQATHRGDGKRLPFMNRSFVSFTYGGKHIEDFNLIATISGERLSKSGYGNFDDTVTTYDNLDGQHYWSTHYRSNQLDFTLSTDGIDQRTLDDFLYWFKPGTIRELILAEHPNRAIMARIANPPELSMLPFESEVEFVVMDSTYKTKTTLYKGDINISFIMDQPHWYAIMNILGIQNGNKYQDIWIDDNNVQWDIFASQDALKILYEDGIPLGSMIDSSMLLGNGMYANAEANPISLIWSKLESDEGFEQGIGARIEADDAVEPYQNGIIAGAIMDVSGNGISLLPKYSTDADMGFFFYSGTAPAPTIISFTLTPEENNQHYIVSPCNSYSFSNVPYNTLTIGSIHDQEMRFTTPNLFTSYNKAILTFHDKAKSGFSWEDVRIAIRDNVRHEAVRNWASYIINYMHKIVDNNDLIQNNYSERMSLLMSYMLKNKSQQELTSVSFTFNSETGEATGSFNYRIPSGQIPTENNDELWKDYGTLKQNIIEDTGDMLRSNYIIIQDRNYPNTEQGKVIKWESTNTITKQYSHYIKHDVNGGLTNLQVLYKNMYL